MSFSAALPGMLLLALALVMFGLGLSLRLDDFIRLRYHGKAVAIALGLQMIVLPAVCWGLILAFRLPPAFAVGLMLLAASPGGVSANLFSHVFGGNVALNISLTAINTLLSVVTLPIVANLALAAFAQGGAVPLQTGKVVEVILLVLLPVVVGMLIAARWPALAARLEKPFKIFSALVLAAFTVIAITREWQTLLASAVSIGTVVVLFNLVSLLSGYGTSRAAGLAPPMATAISFEIGIHNSTLAMYIALSVLNDFQMALPAAVYSVSMYLIAPLFGWWLLHQRRLLAKLPSPAAAAAGPAPSPSP